MSTKHLSPTEISALRGFLNLDGVGREDRRELRRRYKITAHDLWCIKEGRLTGYGPGRYKKMSQEKVDAVVREMRELGLRYRNANKLIAEHHGLDIATVSRIRCANGLRQRKARSVSRPRHNIKLVDFLAMEGSE